MRSEAPVPTRSHGDLAGTVVYSNPNSGRARAGGGQSPEISEALGNFLETNPPIILLYDFWSLSGGAIFDEFTSKNGKKNQMGYVARFVLSSITKNRLSFRTIPSNGPDSTENWQEYLGSKLADLKKERTQQKNFFVKLCDNYPEFLQKVRELCVQWYEQKIRRDAQKSSVPAPNECDDADVFGCGSRPHWSSCPFGG